MPRVALRCYKQIPHGFYREIVENYFPSVLCVNLDYHPSDLGFKVIGSYPDTIRVQIKDYEGHSFEGSFERAH